MRCTLSIVVLMGGALAPAAPARAGDPELIAGLIAALDDPDGEVRQNVALTLANLGEEAVPALLTALTDPKPNRRAGAASALGYIRPSAKSAIPALMDALKDRDEGVRRQASYALSRMVRKAPPSVTVTADRPPDVPPPDPTPKLP
jgi:HEAT repeat protein